MHCWLLDSAPLTLWSAVDSRVTLGVTLWLSIAQIAALQLKGYSVCLKRIQAFL
jgi:hypothetical protein